MRPNKYPKRHCSINAEAKIKEDVTEVELDNPSAPAGNPAPVALRMEPQAAPAPAKPKRSRRTMIKQAGVAAARCRRQLCLADRGRYQETKNANLRQAKVTVASRGCRPHRRGGHRR